MLLHWLGVGSLDTARWPAPAARQHSRSHSQYKLWIRSENLNTEIRSNIILYICKQKFDIRFKVLTSIILRLKSRPWLWPSVQPVQQSGRPGMARLVVRDQVEWRSAADVSPVFIDTGHGTISLVSVTHVIIDTNIQTTRRGSSVTSKFTGGWIFGSCDSQNDTFITSKLSCRN